MDRALEDIVSKDNIRYDEPMAKHTTMRVGGKADVLVLPSSIQEIVDVISYAKQNKILVTILGNGSNVIVSDQGIEGIVIKIHRNLATITLDNDSITALAGATMPMLASVAKKHALSGMEFACGIPGTIGGGVKMNAGAYGHEMSSVFVGAKYLDDSLALQEITKEQMQFSYRHSFFLDHPSYVIVEATFKLTKDSTLNIEQKMQENMTARKTKQPWEYPSAGSVFRRPEGYFVGKLVQDSGLKGVHVGGAYVSEKHTGFIVNKDNATCSDIQKLIALIQDTVYEKFNVKLQTEVEFIGRL